MGVDAMLARLTEKMYLTKGEKSYLFGCVSVVLLTAIMTLVIMAGLDAPYTLRIELSSFVYWVAIAGAMSGGVALYLSRGWMGGAGGLGFVRAIVGSVAVAAIASIIAGTLTVPFEGTIYGPLIVLSTFIAKPLLAAVWFAGMLAAHYLMTILEEERAFGLGRDAHRSATSQLSALSRAQLYHRD